MSHVFLYFVNALWQVPLLVATVLVALRLVPTPARVQHLVWAGTLVAAVLFPLRGAFPTAHTSVVVTFADGQVHAGSERQPTHPWRALAISPQTRDAIAATYLLFLGWAAARLLFSLGSSRALRRRAVVCALSPDQSATVARLTGTLHLRSAPAVLSLPKGRGAPVVAGVLRPAVMLPDVLFASPDDFEAVLAHEFAHLARRDPVLHLAFGLLVLPIAFHPAALLLSRRLQQTRELSCDALAAAALRSPSRYAHSLLSVARQLTGPASHAALALFKRSTPLEERIMHLVHNAPPLTRRTRLTRALAAAATCASAATLAATLHWSPAVLAAQTDQPATLALAEAQSTPPAVAPVATAPAQVHPQRPKSSAATPDAPAAVPPAEPASAQTEQLRQQLRAMVESTVNAQLQQQLAALHAQLNSPAFRDQIRQAQTQALADAQRQLNSPEVRAELARASAEAASSLDSLKMLPAQSSGQGGPARLSGGVMAGQILTKVAPVYPEDAKAAGISGAVVLHAVIGEDGTITSLTVVSGPEKLRDSALEAVRQWTYKPYMLNGQPTAVDTTITVTYSFGG